MRPEAVSSESGNTTVPTTTASRKLMFVTNGRMAHFDDLDTGLGSGRYLLEKVMQATNQAGSRLVCGTDQPRCIHNLFPSVY